MSKLTDYKILIAEDEESLAMLIDYNLIKNGYKTKIVKDGDFVFVSSPRNRLERFSITGSTVWPQFPI